ncbi:MAG TPA: ABC transporter ATP-binding protein [Mycobacteriales bacterium]|jgi:ABC-2 type transport system ATP-binding protein|nr:ABC transporter ATP-binding protein [Mycobacteriales bacterium]
MESIDINGLTRTYGDTRAVDNLTFTVMPGRVTGFLGPNGAGKSTTMRLVLGLERPDGGTATIGGKQYADLTDPLRQVGALLEARALHPGRSARNHLRYLATTQGISMSRVDELLELVGLADVADKRIKGFSLGMGQRLGVAVALLGDPGVLMLDEPVNGLDVEGVRWIRDLLRGLADEGRTVLLSSHLLSEVAVTADHLVVIRDGKLIADCSTSELLDGGSSGAVLVVTPEPARLEEIVVTAGGRVLAQRGYSVTVGDLPATRIGELTARAQLVLHELTPQRASLEDMFVELTAELTTTGSAS